MTTYNIEKIGLIAHYSNQGNQAFNWAFKFARERNNQLNIFYFLKSTFDMPQDKAPKEVKIPDISDDLLIAEERKLREYYDETLGDYVDVGFKVCESVRHNFELRSCLMKQDFNILFIPYLYKTIPFGNMPIEEFAYRFHAPIVLVGPSENEFYINPPAHIVVDRLYLPDNSWHLIEEPENMQELAVL